MYDLITSLSIEDVDSEIARGFRSMRFAPLLERYYEIRQFPYRARYMKYCAVIAIVIYNAFLFSDWMMIPDVFVESCMSRLAVFTPLSILTFWVLDRCQSPKRLELLWTMMEVIAVLLMMRIMVRSSSVYVSDYSYGTVLVMLYTSMVQRPPIVYVAVACIMMFAIQVWAIAISPQIDHLMFQANLEFFISATILLLAGAYALEREKRLGFLMAMRGEILNAQLDRMSKTDPLTGLWNRRHLTETMTEAWTHAFAQQDARAAIVILDIDHFKAFNDTYGHLKGDDCLKRIAWALCGVLRGNGGEIVVRFGGEEFVVFLPAVTEMAAVEIAERLRQAVRAAAIPHPVMAPGAVVTASFGVASRSSSDVTPDMLIQAADNALYRAKSEGRDRVRSSQNEQPSVVESFELYNIIPMSA